MLYAWRFGSIRGAVDEGSCFGSIPVISDTKSRRLEGIVTDRDICCRITAEGRDPKSAHVDEAMTRNPVTCGPNNDLEECEELMQRHQLRWALKDTYDAVVDIVKTTSARMAPASSTPTRVHRAPATQIAEYVVPVAAAAHE